MAESWQDCPALGPGWKRRESFRKSGASFGRSDIYYQSPTGEKIRSKVELTRYLGPACDLTLFDFRQGTLCHPIPKTHPLAVPSKKKKKPSKPACTEVPVQAAQCSAPSWVVALPQVKQETADAPEEWTAVTTFLTSSTLQSGFPSKAADPDLSPVKQEPPGPEEDGEEKKDDVSETTPAEEIGGVGTPVITEIFSLGGTRLRDAEAWLPRSKDLKNPEAKMQ